jgi:sporulation protein YlmC with PRC-barrel domain
MGNRLINAKVPAHGVPAGSYEGKTMLRSLNDIQDYAMHATDGDIGHLRDVTFDERTWVVRYLVVDAGTWLANRQVLISPIGIAPINWREQSIPVSITRQQVERSPAFDSLQPLTREHEIEYLGHYRFPFYWGGTNIWGSETYPRDLKVPSVGLDIPPFNLLREEQGDFPARESGVMHQDPALHSAIGLKGCRVVASDGDVGHVTDLVFDEDTWAIRYLVVETTDWWQAHQLLIAPQSIDKIDWGDITINLSMVRHEVKAFPHHDPSVKVDRHDEVGAAQPHVSPDYWIVEVAREEEQQPSSLRKTAVM